MCPLEISGHSSESQAAKTLIVSVSSELTLFGSSSEGTACLFTRSQPKEGKQRIWCILHTERYLLELGSSKSEVSIKLAS